MRKILFVTNILFIVSFLVGCNEDSTYTNYVDTEKPVVSLSSTGDTVFINSDFTEPSCIVDDNVDKNLVCLVTGNVDVSAEGTYVLSYTAIDSSGNVADSIDYIVDVITPSYAITDWAWGSYKIFDSGSLNQCATVSFTIQSSDAFTPKSIMLASNGYIVGELKYGEDSSTLCGPGNPNSFILSLPSKPLTYNNWNSASNNWSIKDGTHTYYAYISGTFIYNSASFIIES